MDYFEESYLALIASLISSQHINAGLFSIA